MVKVLILLCGVFVASFVVSSNIARAKDPVLLASYGDWEAYTEIENGKQVCYVGTAPKKSKGKYKKRGDVFLLVTHRPKDKELNVVSIQFGYKFKKNAEVSVKIDKNIFKLFTHAGYAFARDQKTDLAIVKSMIKGTKMIVRGTSARGTKTIDTFSLRGFTAGYKIINKKCKVR